MTATPYQLVSRVAGALTDTNLTLAGLMGRTAPADREYDDFTVMQPYVIPWSLSADGWGCSYPAGLVCVVGAAHVAQYDANVIPGDGRLPTFPQPYSASYTSLIDDYWTGVAGVPVPGVLPGGYTPRLERDEFAVIANPGASSVSGGSPYQLRTASGYSETTWQPVSADAAFGYEGFSYNQVIVAVGPGVETHHDVAIGRIGARRIKYIWNATSSSGFGLDTTVLLKRDGSTVESHTFTDASFNGFNQSPEITATGLETSVGGAGVWTLVVQGGRVAGIMTIKVSPNLTVPFPFTATGDYDLIAPGGVP